MTSSYLWASAGPSSFDAPALRRVTRLHAGWEFVNPRWLEPPGRVGFSYAEWLPAEVPGHVHRDLERAGIIADPFSRLYELGAQWVDESDWTYRTEFEFHADAARPRRTLRFLGLDTVCSVRLNGELLAEHDNMFVPLEVDVTAHLVEGTNRLEVAFQSASRVGRERRARYFTEQGLAPNLTRFDEAAFVRKAQYMFGWDWGPRLVSAGIWAPVELVEYRARLTDVHVLQRHLEDGSVELEVHSELDGDGEVRHFLSGSSEPLRDGEVRRIQNPKLWWPAGLGEPHLYELESVLCVPGDTAVLDRRVQRIGLRTLRLLREDDRLGQSFEFEVNGRRFYALGANWIPDSSFPSELPRERIHAQLERARAMNMNMLRVWGGGLYESDDFYDTADALGLLIWQDFPYACSYYPDGELEQALARREAEFAVRRLRNRPSLALWCGNNENLTMFQSKWDDPKRHPPRYYGEEIYERALPKVLAELDPSRPYIPTSPWGGTNANDGGTGDQHYWDVWHGRGDWKYYADSSARFASEFGFAAAPSPTVFREIAPHAADPLALPVRDLAARWHDKTLKGYETFIAYAELHYPKAQTLEEWLYFSQLNQRDALRFGIEHFRRSEFCKGSLIWQLNDCWPVQSWAVLDSAFNYKAAAYELRRLYAPYLVSVVVEAGEARIFAILDNASTPLEDRVRLDALSSLDGRVLRTWEAPVRLAPGERKLALTASLGELEPESTLLRVRYADQETVRLLTEPKTLKLAEPRLLTERVSGGLRLSSDVPVLDLFLWDELGTHFEPNFVTLYPGESIAIRGAGAPRGIRARSLSGPHELSEA